MEQTPPHLVDCSTRLHRERNNVYNFKKIQPQHFFAFMMQGAPSGEAFIQMDSEKSAESTALTKNKKLMFVNGIRRYVEVIQCSGDEMAVVLQHGLPAPAAATLSSVPQSSASIHATNGAVLPTGFWSLPPPTAPTTDLTVLLQQANTIPLPSAPGIYTTGYL